MQYKTCPECKFAYLDHLATSCQPCGASLDNLDDEHQDFRDLLVKAIGLDAQELAEMPHAELIEVHNEIVSLIRDASMRDLATGIAKVEVRRGLILSKEWDVHFNVLYEENPRTLLWVALKNSLLGNPLAGEVTEWENLVDTSAELKAPSTGNGKKIAGAAAVGLLAGFLFG